MANVIAQVRLAPGNPGYFDELTRIYLTIKTPEKPVFEGWDVSGLKRAVRNGTIFVSSGSLEPAPFQVVEEVVTTPEVKIEPVVEVKPIEVKENIVEEKVVEVNEVKAEEISATEPVTEIQEEVTENAEETTEETKKTRKKTTK